MLTLLALQQPSGSAAWSLLEKSEQRLLERAKGNLCNELPGILKAIKVFFTAGELLFKDREWRSCLAFQCFEAGNS